MDRDRELDAVRTALDDLLDGRPRLLLIEGPAGIGKTRLLTEARRLAGQRSVRVLSARGSQLEKAFGFGAVRQLFEPELTDPDRRDELLGGAAAGARGVFDLAATEAAEGSFAVLHGLYWLAVNLTAGGPVLLAVDDVQWCDSASLRWLAYLVRRLEALPVLIVGTLRTGEQHEDDELLAELELDPAATVLRPEPLSPDATTGIVALRLGEPVSPLFAHACHRTTAGNPLLLRQLLRALESDGVRPDAAHADSVVAVGSRAVSSMVLVRLRRLGERITAVARAAAVLGDGAPLPAVAALAELPERDTAAALAALARAEVVKDEQPLAFVHPLVREAVYRDLPAAERELGHERAAAVLRGGRRLRRADRRAPPAGAAAGGRRHGDGAAVGRPDRRRPGRVGQRDHLPPPRAGRAAGRHRAAGRARRAGHGRVAAGRRHRPAPPAAGLRAARRPRDPGRPRDRDRAHPRLRQPAGHRDGVRPGGAAGAARRADRPAPGPARAGTDRRLHARPGPGDLAHARTRPSRPPRARAPRCWRPRWPGRRRSPARTASAPSGWPASRTRATGSWPSTTGCCGSWRRTSG